MNHAQFYDHATKADQSIISNNNNVSSPLKINKASHFIKKSSSNSLPSSSSSSSLYNGVAATTSTTIIPPRQPRHPVIIYTHSPKVIHTHPRDFMALVQKLTGLSPEDDHSSPSHPPRPVPQHFKSEPINEEEDLISCPESCLGDILGSDKENIFHTVITNNINNKSELLSNDDNESTSVVTDENNGSYNVGDNSSASCYVPPPPIFDLANISDNKDINSGISDHNNNLSDPPGFFDSNLTPFDPSPITNSTDFFFSDQQFCNYTDSMFFISSMRNSFSSSSSDSTKELPDF